MGNTNWKREDVRFSSAESFCAGWLYQPQHGKAPGPALIMGHGLGAVKEMGLAPYAEAFVAAGYVVLVFDYRHFGESGGEPRQLLDIQHQLTDWRAALAYVRSLAPVNPDQVAIFGSSFGGGHVMTIAAEDRQVAAAIAQCPFTSGIASARTLGLAGLLKVTALSLADQAGSWLGREPRLIPLAGPPRSAALMNAADAQSGYQALLPRDNPPPDQVAARVGLAISRYLPGRRARHVQCPILFLICEPDSVAPAGPTLRYARQAPNGQIIQYPIGHFDIYHGENRDRAISDSLTFLQVHLPVTKVQREQPTKV